MRLPRFLPAALCIVALTAIPAFAAGTDPAEVHIERQPGEPSVSYSLEQLRQDFPQHMIETATPWSKGGEKFQYRGPRLKDIIAKNGIDGRAAVEVTAFDNYITKITNEEISTYSPILAVERACTEADRSSDGCSSGQDYKPLSLDDGGPYYIIWPLEQLPKAYVPGRNSIWVWFVVKMRAAD
ncbi:hypothetical protein M8997_012880 [Phyllobacterium sp. 21LDTY02-6]|uniref:hypothetical protein n=1 Tax=Phyllobacterium sp. 21LDTY02-6 TaxID=2944903 RepID=UPI00202206AF|nr:hypothetical protein [Phyllobacterium sp. 21LDTY02-6]MCO4318080.1 hypothetical protein [Phyllobacterium sp. 21LDTY02-6]